jgi:enoyl-CoA hydratase/carnithine racemase
MTQSTDISLSNESGILTITLSRLEKKNALTQSMYAAAALALDHAAADASVRVAVIQGHERIFTAGNDLSDFANAPPEGQDAPVFRFLRAIATFPKPLLASVCGPAVGIGTTMLLHCDFVILGDNALLSMPFANLGLCPEAASSYLLPAALGYPRAAEMLLFGEAINAERAIEFGMANRIVAPSEANALAASLAAKLAAKPMSSMIATKALMKRPHANAVADAMAEEGKHFGRMLREGAAKEAFAAFLEKRKPDFAKY